jgi:hypothetical protein
VVQGLGCGGDDRDRTDGLRLARAALSQLSYIPTEQHKFITSAVGRQPVRWVRVHTRNCGEHPFLIMLPPASPRNRPTVHRGSMLQRLASAVP